MVCTAYIVRSPKATKAYPHGKPKLCLTAQAAQEDPSSIPPNATICQGRIKAIVEVEGSGCCANCYSEELTTTYKCIKRGNTTFPDLPAAYDLSAWLTSQIALLPQP